MLRCRNGTRMWQIKDPAWAPRGASTCGRSPCAADLIFPVEHAVFAVSRRVFSVSPTCGLAARRKCDHETGNKPGSCIQGFWRALSCLGHTLTVYLQLSSLAPWQPGYLCTAVSSLPSCMLSTRIKNRNLFPLGPVVAKTSYLPRPLRSPCATCSLQEGCRRRRRRPFSPGGAQLIRTSPV